MQETQGLRAALQAQSAALAHAESAKQAADRSRADAELECQRLQQSLMYAWKGTTAVSTTERSGDSVAVTAADAAIAGAASTAPALPAP